MGTTLYMGHRTRACCIEQNPLIAWSEPHVGLRGTMAIGAGLEIAAVLIGCKVIDCKRRPTVARVLLAGATAAHAHYGTQNLRRIDRR